MSGGLATITGSLTFLTFFQFSLWIPKAGFPFFLTHHCPYWPSGRKSRGYQRMWPLHWCRSLQSCTEQRREMASGAHPPLLKQLVHTLRDQVKYSTHPQRIEYNMHDHKLGRWHAPSSQRCEGEKRLKIKLHRKSTTSHPKANLTPQWVRNPIHTPQSLTTHLRWHLVQPAGTNSGNSGRGCWCN